MSTEDLALRVFGRVRMPPDWCICHGDYVAWLEREIVTAYDVWCSGRFIREAQWARWLEQLDA